jgi:hypothetical protein
MKSEIKFAGDPEVAYRIIDSMHNYIDNVPKDRRVTIVITIEDEPLSEGKDNEEKQASYECQDCDVEYKKTTNYYESICHVFLSPVKFKKEFYKEVCALLDINAYDKAILLLQSKLGIDEDRAEKLCDYILDNDFELSCKG